MDPAMATGGDPAVRLKVAGVRLAGSIGSLKVALALALIATPSAPSSGAIDTTVGAVAFPPPPPPPPAPLPPAPSSPSSPPQAAMKEKVRRVASFPSCRFVGLMKFRRAGFGPS